MNLNARDKKILTALVPLVLLGALWFGLISPQRASLAKLNTEADTAKSEQSAAEAQVQTLQAAKASYASDYEAVVRLGKAIPANVDMPSLLVQLESASQGAHIAFDSINSGARVSAAASTGGTGAATPAGSSSAGSSAPVAAGGAKAQTGAGKATEQANNAAATSNKTSAASGSSASTAPTGTAGSGGSGVAGLDTVPLTFDFNGSYFDLADFFHRLKRFVRVAGGDIGVHGRLMTVDSVSFTSSEKFPTLKAHISATVYLAPKTQGVTAGGTTSGPTTTGQAATPATTSTPSTASPGTSTPGAAATSSSKPAGVAR